MQAGGHRFDPVHLHHDKQSAISVQQSASDWKLKAESGSLAQEYLNLFLSDAPSPGIAYEHRLVQQILEELGRERTLLEKKIEELRSFERDYRARLKNYIEGQLADLDTLAVQPYLQAAYRLPPA